MTTPKRVTVTGAAGQIAYSLLPRIANGDIFGADTPIVLQCLEIPPAMNALRGVSMELEDCAFPLLKGIVCTDDPMIAFKECDLALLVGSKPRGKGQERSDLIRENGPIFVAQGQALERVANPDVRVVVIGNPCNTNCLIAKHHAPKIPARRFTAMTQLDHNRALAQIALRAGVEFSEVKNVTIWGNHSNTQFPDWSQATIAGRKAREVINDDEWFKDFFIPTVQERGKAIIETRGLSSAMSAANAAIDHAYHLFNGTPEGSWTSMAVSSDGSYDVPEGLMSSFPVRCGKDGSHEIVQGIEFSEFGRGKFRATIKELETERDTVENLLR